jgi:UDPglucose 6-dehydrogenase
MVKIGVVGTGFVGLTHGAVMARFGHEVVCYDIDKHKIDAFSSGDKSLIEKYIYENDLSELVAEQLKSNRLKFSFNPNDLYDAKLLFMCLPTPYKDSGESDLSFLFNASEVLIKMFKEHKVSDFRLFVNKSTVPVGTAGKLRNFLESHGMHNFDVASNPEFLPEGVAVSQSIHPPKTIIGAIRHESFELLRNVYSSFYNSPNTAYIESNPETAEAIKYASNTLLYSQIVAWQAIAGKLCESNSEIDFEILRKGALADPRVAKWGSYVSAGAGGSCFKKDDLSLAFQLESKGVDSSYVRLIDTINEHQKTYLINRAEHEAEFDFNNKIVAILGVSFKQGTNDIRESNTLKIIPLLIEKGVKEIRLYDPLALNHARTHFNKATYANKIVYNESSELALNNTDCVIIATDHQEFRVLVQTIINKVNNGLINKPYLLIDGRRIIPKEDTQLLLESGIDYLPVAGVYIKSLK